MGVVRSALHVLLLCCVGHILVVCVTLPVRADVCTPEAERKASELIDGQLKDWSEVNFFYQSYAQCDDGVIGEGLSDDIARLLAQKWETLPVLDALIKKDVKLKSFVLMHLETTLSNTDLMDIVQNAKEKCPTGHHPLCNAVSKTAAKAIRNM